MKYFFSILLIHSITVMKGVGNLTRILNSETTIFSCSAGTVEKKKHKIPSG